MIDHPVLRQAIEKQMDRIEHVHRFTRAVSVGNPQEFLQAEKEDQEMAEACKRLIKNCIICWNYLLKRWLCIHCHSRFEKCSTAADFSKHTGGIAEIRSV